MSKLQGGVPVSKQRGNPQALHSLPDQTSHEGQEGMITPDFDYPNDREKVIENLMAKIGVLEERNLNLSQTVRKQEKLIVFQQNRIAQLVAIQ
jgi:hypothetical protein